MIEEGDVVLFRFPQTDLQEGKLRPALVIIKSPWRIWRLVDMYDFFSGIPIQ